ncbi:hypothetical protein A2U01_0023768, partial [Trifolium medium]|nr:hypothetical protein [Trifolium medium]
LINQALLGGSPGLPMSLDTSCLWKEVGSILMGRSIVTGWMRLLVQSLVLCYRSSKEWKSQRSAAGKTETSMCAIWQIFAAVSGDFEIFATSEVEHRFTNSISAKTFHTERGFLFNMKDTTLAIPADFARVITHHKWQRLALHPTNFNSQIVKEFYSNLTNPAQKVREVVVRGKGVLYSEQNINKYFKLEGGDCAYQATLAQFL